jgi:hypothetical protein
MKASAICGALVAGSAALLPLGVLPILLGGLVEAGRLSQAGVGRAATLETLGLALGAGVGAHWMGRGSMRLKTASAAFALAGVNVATAHAASSAAVLLDRAAAGLLAGLLLGAANAIIVRTQTPHRLSGAMLGLSTLPQILAAYLLPVLVIPRFGVTAGFYLLAAGVLLAALCAWTMVDAVEPLERPRQNTARTSLPLLLFAGAVVLQSGGIGAAWTYVERLAPAGFFTIDGRCGRGRRPGLPALRRVAFRMAQPESAEMAVPSHAHPAADRLHGPGGRHPRAGRLHRLGLRPDRSAGGHAALPGRRDHRAGPDPTRGAAGGADDPCRQRPRPAGRLVRDDRFRCRDRLLDRDPDDRRGGRALRDLRRQNQLQGPAPRLKAGRESPCGASPCGAGANWPIAPACQLLFLITYVMKITANMRIRR